MSCTGCDNCICETVDHENFVRARNDIIAVRSMLNALLKLHSSASNDAFGVYNLAPVQMTLIETAVEMLEAY